MKVLNLFLGATDAHDANSDGSVLMNYGGTLPFLVFADGYIDNNAILSESVNNDTDLGYEIYIKGEEDVNIILLGSFISKTGGIQTLGFVDNEDGYLTNLPFAQTLNDKLHKDSLVNNSAMAYPVTYENNSLSESLIFSKTLNAFKLPKPNGTFGDTLKIVTIPINGMLATSVPDRHKIDTDECSLYNNSKVLSLLEVDTSNFTDWDPKTLPLYTLVQTATNSLKLKYVGGQDVTKFYIPLQ